MQWKRYEQYGVHNVQKFYIDTNVLISYISGPQKEPTQYPKAQKIFSEIKQGVYVGVISTLVLIELKGVIRTILGTDRPQLETIEQNKQSEYVKSESQKIYDELIGELLQLPNIKFEKGRQSNFQSILDAANQIMDDIKGDVRFYDTCGNCGAQFKSSKHKQILAADILHALLAKDTACDSLITFDKGFAGLVGNSIMSQLQIVIR
ncbi:MAG: PIN domain-containing protein [Thaumarchaeota archaeon]|nr:PIN domain-containing protein [Nitrososphaerota archaeon]